jgi:hypothetical protein
MLCTPPEAAFLRQRRDFFFTEGAIFFHFGAHMLAICNIFCIYTARSHAIYTSDRAGNYSAA